MGGEVGGDDWVSFIAGVAIWTQVGFGVSEPPRWKQEVEDEKSFLDNFVLMF